MKEVKCQICGLECDGKEAGEHWELTGHNSWELLITSEKEKPKTRR